MEKVNINFYDNYTVSYQHKKILQFVPELSVDPNTRITVPNIPLLVSFIIIINYLIKFIIIFFDFPLTDTLDAE